MTKFDDVFLYWKDKCITKDGDVLTEYGYKGCNEKILNATDTIVVIEDWGEPTCFACGKCTGFLNIEDEKYLEILNIDDDEQFAKKLWGRSDIFKGFQRAHIVPKAMGGSDDADNIFCLCERCHKYSPDTRFKEEFFKWVYNRRNEPNIFQKAFQRCQSENIFPLFDPKDLNLNNINSHGAFVEDSTLVSGLVGIARERTQKVLKAKHEVLEIIFESTRKEIHNFDEWRNIVNNQLRELDKLGT